MRAIAACAICAGLLAGCPSPATPPIPPTAPSSVRPGPASHDPESAFRDAAESFYAADMAFHPAWAARLGHHRYDGIVPDRSHSAITTEVARLRRAGEVFKAMAAARLSPRSRLERQVILQRIRAQRFELDTLGAPFKNPLYYPRALALSEYVSRPYETLAERARAIVGICNGAPDYINEAEVNLPETMPRTWIDAARFETHGMLAFAQRQVPAAMRPIAGTPLSRELDRAIGNCVTALADYQQFLTARRRRADDGFALGAAKLAAKLAATDGVAIDLRHLEAVARADLARNTAALRRAAGKLAPAKTVAEVVASVRRARRGRTRPVDVARRQAAALKKFVVAHHLVSIPINDITEVRVSPPSLRWKPFSFSAAGLFETGEVPSFFYIAPAPRAPASNGALFSATIRALWPGRYVFWLHEKVNRSPILKSYCTGATRAGWAAYAQQMMLHAGVDNGDLRYRIAGLADAVRDDVRLIAAIRLGARGMTVAQAAKLFEGDAFEDAATARREAARATFDPDDIDGALGKLMILKLRADWNRKLGSEYSLRAFNDALLSYGCAPIPVIRRAMLGKRAGKAL